MYVNSSPQCDSQVRVIPSYPDLMSSGSMDMMKGSMLDGI